MTTPAKEAANAACKSVECKDRENVGYNMHVGYVIIAGESELYTKEREFALRYEWDTSDEIFLETQRRTAAVQKCHSNTAKIHWFYTLGGHWCWGLLPGSTKNPPGRI